MGLRRPRDGKTSRAGEYRLAEGELPGLLGGQKSRNVLLGTGEVGAEVTDFGGRPEDRERICWISSFTKSFLSSYAVESAANRFSALTIAAATKAVVSRCASEHRSSMSTCRWRCRSSSRIEGASEVFVWGRPTHFAHTISIYITERLHLTALLLRT